MHKDVKQQPEREGGALTASWEKRQDLIEQQGRKGKLSQSQNELKRSKTERT